VALAVSTAAASLARLMAPASSAQELQLFSPVAVRAARPVAVSKVAASRAQSMALASSAQELRLVSPAAVRDAKSAVAQTAA
jgi:predicted protein tyrosine phosphatase